MEPVLGFPWTAECKRWELPAFLDDELDSTRRDSAPVALSPEVFPALFTTPPGAS